MTLLILPQILCQSMSAGPGDWVVGVFFLETWGIKICCPMSLKEKVCPFPGSWSSSVFDGRCEFPSCTCVQDKPVALYFSIIYSLLAVFHNILDDVKFSSPVACTQRNETFVILILTPLLYICIVIANFWDFQLRFRSWTLQKNSSSSKINI